MALASLVPGTTFAQDFIVGELIAAGGMGAVYRAEQRSTGNAVALKIMLPELLVDPKSRERFEHEARISGRIKSSHVVRVLAAGIDEPTQTPWLAMEFLEGESLAAFARARGPLAPGVALAILQQVGHALSAAHAAGVVHCDLKPENVFIADARSVGAPFDVKVLDFGIARIVKEGRKSASVTTAVGSPHWLAPEQGSVGKTVGPPTDVWPFGLLAFWLLTGRYYWFGANVPENDYNLYALLGEIAGRDPLAPASERLRALGEARALLPAGFDGWFARCVDRDPGRRFASAREAVAALVEVLSLPGEAGVAATRPSGPSVQPAPVAVTREMTVGVPGMAPPGHPALGAADCVVEVTPSMAGAPARKRGPVAAVVAALGVGLGVVGVVAAGGAPTPIQRVPPATVVAPTPPPSPATTVPPVPAPTCPEGMALIPAGTFMMGSPEGEGSAAEHPQHPVSLSAFCMDRTEVTVAAYRVCVTGGACTAAASTVDWPGISALDRRRLSPLCQANRTGVDQHPVNCVDWEQAVAYCHWRGAQLPTEAQWEYAARGTDGRAYPWGNEPPTAARLNACGEECDRAHPDFRWTPLPGFGDDQWPETAPVGSYPLGASPFWVFDMVGNVSEWTADWYVAYATPTGSPVTDPRPADDTTGATSRVVRGASWSCSTASELRASYRNGIAPAGRAIDLGFRCARGAT